MTKLQESVVLIHQRLVRALVPILLAQSISPHALATLEEAQGRKDLGDDSPKVDDPEGACEDARKAYDSGDKPGALAKLERCYLAKPIPNVAYNIAVVSLDLADCAKALEYFERYAGATIVGDRLEEAKQQIAMLSERCPASKPQASQLAPATTVTLTIPEPQQNAPAIEVTSATPSSWRTIGLVSLATGVATGAAAAYFAALAIQANHDTEQRPISAEYFNERESAFRRNSTYAVVLSVTSVAALGLGAYGLLFQSPIRGASASVSAESIGIQYAACF